MTVGGRGRCLGTAPGPFAGKGHEVPQEGIYDSATALEVGQVFAGYTIVRVL